MGLEKVEALQNLVVLDLTRVVAGPYAGSILGDFGAEVIKIEVPGKGDDARSYGPYRNGESVYYANLNRNKKGITLNLKTEEGAISRSTVAERNTEDSSAVRKMRMWQTLHLTIY